MYELPGKAMAVIQDQRQLFDFSFRIKNVGLFRRLFYFGRSFQTNEKSHQIGGIASIYALNNCHHSARAAAWFGLAWLGLELAWNWRLHGDVHTNKIPIQLIHHTNSKGPGV